MELTGDIKSIRTSHLQELDELSREKTARSELIGGALLHSIVRLTQLYHKEIAVFITRSGQVLGASFGRHSSVTLPRLKGRISPRQVRCIHTHPGGTFQLSSLDLSALESLGLESMSAIGVDVQGITAVQCAVSHGENTFYLAVIKAADIPEFDYERFCREAQAFRPARGPREQDAREGQGEERAILIVLTEDNPPEGEDTLSELKELSRTAGVKILGAITQPRRYQDHGSYLGKGKIEELSHLIQNTHANLVICDDELKPGQERALEQMTGVKIIDRSALILDIFAQRAHSREGKLQVELAQLQYILPRLLGQGASLSRLGGGIGTRGPGETKLETDRRHIRQRISFLEEQLGTVRQNRETQRKQRARSGLPLIGLVGYTNAGKTTLMQRALALSGSAADIPQGEDKLFATLDPLVRKVRIGPGHEVLISDTVGFIQKLPHHLLKAFLATLEEVQNADLLIHVLDAAHPLAVERAETVRQVLIQLGCEHKPTITLLNKIDQVTIPEELTRLAQLFSHPVALSLLHTSSLTALWQEVSLLLDH